MFFCLENAERDFFSCLSLNLRSLLAKAFSLGRKITGLYFDRVIDGDLRAANQSDFFSPNTRLFHKRQFR